MKPTKLVPLSIAVAWSMLLAVFLFSAAANAQSTNSVLTSHGETLQVIQDQPDGPSYVAGEVLIKFKAGANDQLVADVVRRAVITGAKHIQTEEMSDSGDIGITRVTTGLPVAQALRALQNHQALEYAQPNWVYQHQTAAPSTFDDTYFRNGSLWGVYDGSSTLTVDRYGSGAVAAWDLGFTGSRGVYVGVIDEGIEYYHPDLAANIWTNPNPGVSGDLYVGDVHGWNAVDDSGNIYDPNYDDHGTHVAGTIGALGANGRGVAGINWNVTIICGKFLGPGGSGSTADAIQAIDYMTYVKTSKGLNIVALNNSWGGTGLDPALLDAIKRAADQDILFVAAAGNGNSSGVAVNTDRTPFYPACYDTTAVSAKHYNSVISVTAIDQNGAKPTWANYGKTTVDLGAPGVGIWSTLPGGSYGSYDGTSMATPHVTGAIALYASVHPGASAAEIKQALLDSSKLTPTPSLANTVTGGRLDVMEFLNTPSGLPVSTLPAPAAPTFLDTSSAVSSSQIDLFWTPGGSAIETGFKITRSVSGSPDWSIIVGPDRTSYSDKYLPANTPYNYTIVAYNAGGESSPTSINISTPQFTGTPPTAKFVSKDTTTKGSWINHYGAGGYNVIPDFVSYPSGLTLTPDGQSVWGWAYPFSTSFTDVRDLQSQTNPNARGAACWYSAGTFTVDLNFTDTSVHRVALYCLDWESAGRAQTIDILDPAYNTVLSSQSISSFSGGQYLLWDISGHVTLRFTRTGGNNAVLSGIFFDTPPTPPAAPTGLTATPGSGQVSLSWVNVSGATSYNVKRSTVTGGPYTTISTTSATSYTDKSVTGGTTYYYVVTAVNTAGESGPSNPASATPSAPPDFSLSASPASQTVTRGKSTTYTVTVTPFGGFSGTVSLSAAVPSGVSASFSPTSVTGSGTSAMTAKTTSQTSRGTKTLTITGKSGTLTHSTTVTLIVQ